MFQNDFATIGASKSGGQFDMAFWNLESHDFFWKRKRNTIMICYRSFYEIYLEKSGNGSPADRYLLSVACFKGSQQVVALTSTTISLNVAEVTADWGNVCVCVWIIDKLEQIERKPRRKIDLKS